MQHLEGPIAEIDDVAGIEQPCRRGRHPIERGGRQTAGRDGIDEEVGDLVPGVEIGLAHRRPEHAAVEFDQPGRRQPFRLRSVDGAVAELVHATDVVGMGVCRHGEHVVSDRMLDQVAERLQAERRVDDEILAATVDVPHVAPQQWMDVRLGDQGDPVVDPLGDEPRVGHGEIEHIRRLRRRGLSRSSGRCRCGALLTQHRHRLRFGRVCHDCGMKLLAGWTRDRALP